MNPGERWTPTEVLQAIFCQLSVTDPQGLLTLVRFTSVDKRLRSVVRLPAIWKPHYRFTWRRSDPIREASRRERMGKDWYALTMERGKIDHKASSLLDAMLVIPSVSEEFMELAREIVDGLGRDVWDYLHSRIRLFSSRGKSDRRWLSRAYWAGEMIGVLERRMAVDRLLKLREPDSMSLDEGLSVPGAFWSADYESIQWELDDLASQCRRHLHESEIHLPDSDEIQLEEICRGIWDFMFLQGFGPAGTTEHSNTASGLLHLALTTTRQTLSPLLVAIFIAIVQRIGLEAHPVDFPHNVHAIVRHVTTGSSIAVDVYAGSSKLFPTNEELTAKLLAEHPHVQDVSGFLAPTSTRDIVQRVFGHFQQTLFRPDPLLGNERQVDGEWELARALYALDIMMILMRPLEGQTMGRARHLSRVYACMPLDYELVVQSHVIPALEAMPGGGRLVYSLRLPRVTVGSELWEVTRDSRGGKPSAAAFVGLLMYHKQEKWVGIVCDRRRKRVIVNNTVDPLQEEDIFLRVCYSPPGASSALVQGPQNIHHAPERDLAVVHWPISHGGSQQETDKKELSLSESTRAAWGDLDVLLETIPDIGRKFQDVIVNKDGKVWFVPGPEVEAAYPDDMLLGKALMSEGQ